MTIHGTEDPLVPYEHARRLQTAASKAGVSTSLVPMAGKGHGWGGIALLESIGRSVEFFDVQLAPRSETALAPSETLGVGAR